MWYSKRAIVLPRRRRIRYEVTNGFVRLPRALFQARGEADDGQDGDPSGAHDVHRARLYHLRQSEHSFRGGHPERCGHRLDHLDRGALDDGHGRRRQLSGRARAGHGTQRLFRLLCMRHARPALDSRARRGVLLRRPVPDPHGQPHPPGHHQRRAAESARGHRRGHRPLHRVHRPQGHGPHRAGQGDVHRSRPCDAADDAALALRPRAHGRAHGAQGAGLHPHWHRRDDAALHVPRLLTGAAWVL